MKVGCKFIRMESPEGDASERVEVGAPSRKEKDGPERCNVNKIGFAHFPRK
jgi:hypothetical protein